MAILRSFGISDIRIGIHLLSPHLKITSNLSASPCHGKLTIIFVSHVHGGQRRSLQILFPLEQGSIVNAHWPKYTMLPYLINSTNKSEATETFNTDRRNSWDELSDICQQSPCPHFQPTLQQFPYINGRTVISTFAYWYRRSLGVIYGMKETMTTVNGIIPPLCESLSSRTAVWVPRCGSFVGRCRTSFWPLVFERGIQPSVKLFAKLWGDFSRMLLAKVDPNFALLTLLYIFTF